MYDGHLFQQFVERFGLQDIIVTNHELFLTFMMTMHMSILRREVRFNQPPLGKISNGPKFHANKYRFGSYIGFYEEGTYVGYKSLATLPRDTLFMSV